MRWLLSLLLLACSPAWAQPVGGFIQGPSTPSANPFVQLLATMPSDSWQKLNSATGNGQPYNLLSTLGFTMCNYDGLPPASCGGSGSGDVWTADATVNGSADGAGGANPLTSGAMFAFSSPAMRPTDGKMCSLEAGGHAASVTSAVFCFDTQAAVSALVAAGGYGHTPTGTWSMRVKPARYIGNGNTKPAWSPQPTGGTWWATTNIDGIQRPISCHEYWANQWLGGNKWTQGGSYACNVSGTANLDASNQGGIEIFDDSTNADTFPLNASGTVFGQPSGGNPQQTQTAYDSLSGNDCIWTPYNNTLAKWCNPTNAATALTNVHTAFGMTGAFGIQPITPAIIIPDPVTGGGAYAYFQMFIDANGSDGCGNFFIGEDGNRHPPLSSSSGGFWPNPTTGGCFILWTDIYGSPKAWIAQFAGSEIAGFYGKAGLVWSAAAGKMLLYRGDGNIYQINTAAGLAGLYSDATNGVSSWTITLKSSGAGGASPSPPVLDTSFSNIVALTGLNAEVVYVSNSLTPTVYIHKD